MRKMRALGVAAIATGLLFGATGIAAAETTTPPPAATTGSADQVVNWVNLILKGLTAGSAKK
ncbi:hypothetical protein ACFVUS_34930 [Nocardia sp. NPDC058058]|uniref:hypothetical protein n=1 Tax=Nocardia sp. NPDC058058 TaxID=3346317 RepID=UPI0036D7AF56